MTRSLRTLRVPLKGGRLAYLPREEQATNARALFDTRLFAKHLDPHGHPITDNRHDFDWHPDLGYDLGSGLVTDVGVYAMAFDSQWSASLNLATLALANQHAWGTGATAAAATDIACQTLAAPTTTAAQAGVASVIGTAAVPKYQTVATITAGGTLAITEWGLHSSGTLTATTGTPLTAVSATTGTSTGTTLTASSATVRGQQQTIMKTGTTTVYGLILSNTTGVVTLASVAGAGWWTVAASTAGATPGATEAYTLLPVLWDHKVFTAINVLINDSIQFTYQLQITSGG
jgi:hypothetical protein